MKPTRPPKASWMRELGRRIAWVLGASEENVGISEISPSRDHPGILCYRGVVWRGMTAVLFEFDHDEIDLDMPEWAERLEPGKLVAIKGDG